MTIASAIKRQNKISVYRALLRQKRVNKPELSEQLDLSLPTVSYLINELVSQGVVVEDGVSESIGGRRAVSYCPVLDQQYALGLDMTKNHISMALLDLSGELLAHERIKIPFGREEQDFLRGNALIHQFLREHQISEDKLIGTGYSLPGIISRDGKALAVSHILEIQGEEPFVPRHNLPCDYRCFNDADAACMVEHFADDGLSNFTFLSLSNTVGGAIVSQGQMVSGIHGRTGELGHMCLVPNGRPCYCGQAGHVDAYCSALVLAEKAGGRLEDFFQGLEENNRDYWATFEEYLDALAIIVQNISVLTDLPVVLGGYVSNHLEPYMELLREKVIGNSSPGFASPESIVLCRRKIEAAAVGSALYFVENHIQNI